MARPQTTARSRHPRPLPQAPRSAPAWKVQRLAEPPGTAEQRDRRPRFQDVGDEHRLVDEHRGSHDRLEVAVPDGQPLLAAKIRQARRALRYMPFSNVAASPMPHRLPAEITCPPLYDTRFGREPTTASFFSVVSVALRSFGGADVLRTFRSRLGGSSRTQPPDIPFANATAPTRT